MNKEGERDAREKSGAWEKAEAKAQCMHARLSVVNHSQRSYPHR
jgi:hypothetical protein